METKEKKNQFLNELENEKILFTWINIVSLIAIGGLVWFLINYYKDPKALIIVILSFLGFSLIYRITIKSILNMDWRFQKTIEKIGNEKKYLTSIKEEYIILSSSKFSEIPADL